MDAFGLVLVIAGMTLGGLLVYLLLRRHIAGSSSDSAFGELTGRLTQMAESQAAQQSRIAEQLHGQERVLAKALEERLGDLSKKVGDRLQEQTTRHHEALGDLRERLVVIDKAQQNITALSKEVVGLQDILANKQARGAFGEIQLRDIVESILPPSAYGFQVTLSNGKRADCLLRMPYPPGPIAIDSKFPLESYAALRAANDDAAQRQARSALSADLRRHVKDIAERYIVAEETAESALLFLPSEAVYAELHANFRDVIEYSYRARVWIVSPTTLMATLNTIRAVLKDVRMREQAGIIQTEVGTMLKDVGRLADRVDKLEKHFGQAQGDLREIGISTGKIFTRGERITALELGEAAKEDPESLADELHPSLPEP